MNAPENRPAYLVGWCVRLDWPDGTHDLVDFSPSRPRAERARRATERYWRAGPLAPLDCRVVEISNHDWRLHADRRYCAAPDCPR